MPAYLPRQRWFAAKDRGSERCRCGRTVRSPAGEDGAPAEAYLASVVKTTLRSGEQRLIRCRALRSGRPRRAICVGAASR